MDYPESRIQNPESMNQDEISFSDVIAYLEANGRWLLLGGLCGPLLALVSAVALSQYKADIVMDNLFVGGNQGIGFTEWRSLSETLPIMAGQLFEDRKAAGEDIGDERFLSSPEWWLKHAVPTYGLSKTDTKNLAAMEDDLKGQSTRIVNIKISAEGRTKSLALKRAETTVEYLRRTSLFLRLKNLLSAYQTEAKLQQVALQKELIDRDIELRYLDERIASLSALIASQTKKNDGGKISVDVRNGEAKFLPLDTQLNALKLEVYSLEESRTRTEEALVRTDLLNRFLVEAKPTLDENKAANGLSLLTRLQVIYDGLSASIPKADWVRRSAVERIHADLIAIESRFSGQMPELSRSVQRKIPFLPAVMGGAFGGLLAALLITLFMTRYRRYKLVARVGAGLLPR